MAASNVTLDPMSGGEKVYTDKIGTDHMQGVKVILGALNTNDGPVASGNPMPVNVISALPAGANAIGKLAANSGVDIGDVDVLSVPADPFGANADVAVAAGAAGSIQAKLRRATQGLEDLKTTIVLATGANAIGKLAANSGIDIGDVDVTSIIPGVGATNLGKREDDAHTSLDTGVFMLGVANEANTARGADNDYAPIATDTEGNVRIVGNRDHDAVDAGEVVGIGGYAVAHGANPTAVAAADRTHGIYNRHGVPFTIAGHPNIKTLRTNYTTAQTNAALVTVAAGTKIVVTKASVFADNANTVDVAARIGFGTASTPTGDGTVLSHPGIARGGGLVEGNGSGIIGQGADDEDLRITSEVPTGGSIDVMVCYYTIES